MEHETTLEKLIHRLESYAKTSIKLYKYNAIYTSADIFSTIVTKLVITFVVTIFLVLLNIGLALWIGDELGKMYYGFFVVAGFYLLIALCFYLFQNDWIKKPVSNFIISRILNKN